MKNREFILHIVLVFSLFSLALAWYVLSLKDESLALFKISALFVIVATVALFWILAMMYRNITGMGSTIMTRQNDSEKLLLDLRDGTRNFYKERRKTFRVKTDITAQLISKSICDFIKTIDLSYDGAQIKTTNKFQIGDTIGLNLYLPLFPQPINVRVKVVRVLPEGGDEKSGVYNVGVKYLEMPLADKEKLIETLDTLNKSSSKTSSK